MLLHNDNYLISKYVISLVDDNVKHIHTLFNRAFDVGHCLTASNAAMVHSTGLNHQSEAAK